MLISKYRRLSRKLRNYVRKQIDPIGFAKSIGVSLGNDCRLINVDFGSEPYLVTLGNHVSATKTHFVTHDGGVWVFRQENPDIDVIAPIRVGNNVFLGIDTIVMPGVTIGDNVVVGARSVVTRDLPDNCVAAGVPARIIGSIDQYRSKCFERDVATAKLSNVDKRSILEKRFKS